MTSKRALIDSANFSIFHSLLSKSDYKLCAFTNRFIERGEKTLWEGLLRPLNVAWWPKERTSKNGLSNIHLFNGKRIFELKKPFVSHPVLNEDEFLKLTTLGGLRSAERIYDANLLKAHKTEKCCNVTERRNFSGADFVLIRHYHSRVRAETFAFHKHISHTRFTPEKTETLRLCIHERQRETFIPLRYFYNFIVLVELFAWDSLARLSISKTNSLEKFLVECCALIVAWFREFTKLSPAFAQIYHKTLPQCLNEAQLTKLRSFHWWQNITFNSSAFNFLLILLPFTCFTSALIWKHSQKLHITPNTFLRDSSILMTFPGIIFSFAFSSSFNFLFYAPHKNLFNSEFAFFHTFRRLMSKAFHNLFGCLCIIYMPSAAWHDEIVITKHYFFLLLLTVLKDEWRVKLENEPVGSRAHEKMMKSLENITSQEEKPTQAKRFCFSFYRFSRLCRPTRNHMFVWKFVCFPSLFREWICVPLENCSSLLTQITWKCIAYRMMKIICFDSENFIIFILSNFS